MKTILKNLKWFSLSLILGLVLGGGLIFVKAWTEPTLAPPDGNLGAPINTSSNGQAKTGGLLLNSGGAVNGLIVQNGNVGIGTNNPTKKLDVLGDAGISGVLSSGKVQIVDIVTEGSGCSFNGLIARDINGLILSCQSGAWKRGSGGGGLFRPYEGVEISASGSVGWIMACSANCRNEIFGKVNNGVAYTRWTRPACGTCGLYDSGWTEANFYSTTNNTVLTTSGIKHYTIPSIRANWP